jgi:hypothetical protein
MKEEWKFDIVKLLLNVVCWNALFNLLVQSDPNDTTVLSRCGSSCFDFRNANLMHKPSSIGLDPAKNEQFVNNNNNNNNCSQVLINRSIRSLETRKEQNNNKIQFIPYNK